MKFKCRKMKVLIVIALFMFVEKPFGTGAVSLPQICELAPDAGPCQALIPSWFYNGKTGQCEQFIYGGCKGNANNFETRDQCRSTCKPHCELAPDAGPCQALIPSWFYNPSTGQCEEFTYGGCKGNANNFETEDQCMQECEPSCPEGRIYNSCGSACPPTCSDQQTACILMCVPGCFCPQGQVIDDVTGECVNPEDCPQDATEVMLSEGSYGILTLLHDGEWGTVCDDAFDENDNGCTVICNMLGYTSGLFIRCGIGPGTIWLDQVKCNGTESSIDECESNEWGDHFCGHSEDSSCKCCNVDHETCVAGGYDCVQYPEELLFMDVALSDGSYGTVTVNVNGQWGTVCNDGFNENDNGCMVVCRQLGYRSGINVDCGAGSGLIWLDSVNCIGNETNLAECQRDPTGVHNCDHGDDSGCKCCTSDYGTCAASGRECESLCPEGKIYNACGSACPPTCSDQQPICDKMCVSGCFCPHGQVIDDVTGECVNPVDCVDLG